MKLLATVNHNDYDRSDRVGLFAGPDGWVVGVTEDGDYHDTDVAVEPDLASFGIEVAWGGWEWGLHLIDDEEAHRYAVTDQGFTGDYADWLALPPTERLAYEAGAAGIGTT